MHNLNLLSYQQSSLVAMEVEFRFNLLTLSKYAIIYFNAYHAHQLNTEDNDTLNIEEGQKLGFIKADKGGTPTLIFKCALSNDGKKLISLERINLISKFLGRNLPFYRLATIEKTGIVHVVLCRHTKDAEYIFERQLDMANEYYNNSNAFDRFMKKYFSFYKYVFNLTYSPYIKGFNLFDRIMHQYFSFYK